MISTLTAAERAQYSHRELDELVRRGLFEKELAGKIGMALHRAYPGYNWQVEVESRGGMVHVRALDINGVWGYDVPLKTVLNDQDLRSCVMAAGEILERYAVSREGRKDGEVEDLKRDLRGQAIGDHSAAA